MTSAEAYCRIHPRLNSRGALRRRIDDSIITLGGINYYAKISRLVIGQSTGATGGIRHCEERSDEAISDDKSEIASLRSQ